MTYQVYKYIKDGVHVHDEWSRPIYYAVDKTKKIWFSDINLGCSVYTSLYFMNCGKNYNYDAEPDYPINNFVIVN